MPIKIKKASKNEYPLKNKNVTIDINKNINNSKKNNNKKKNNNRKKIIIIQGKMIKRKTIQRIIIK